MSEQLEHFLIAQREFGERMHAVTPDQWQDRTSCTEWTVADLARHSIDQMALIAPLVHGQDQESALKIVRGARSLPVDGGVGADLAEEWDEAAVAATDALNSDGALERTVAFGSGDLPVPAYLGILTVEFTVHGWDLATAVGVDATPSDELVEFGWNQVKDMGDAFRGNDMFADPVQVPDDAPTFDRLLAMTGRSR